jgi:small-conductance mechanosensitive channel
MSAAVVLAQSSPVPTDLTVITDEFDLKAITAGDLLFAGIAVVAGVVLGQLTRRALRRAAGRLEGLPIMAGEILSRIVGYFIAVLGLVVGLEALGFSLGPVGSLIILVVIGVVLAARPLIQDLGSGLILQIRRPFRVGDQITLVDRSGRVEEINARTVRMITPEGERIHLPNRIVLDGTIVNLVSEGRRMTTFVAGVEYATDLDRAKRVVEEAIAATPSALAEPPPAAFVQQFNSSTIDIACRFWHGPEIETAWRARDEAMRAVKRAFDAEGITIAFPQRVLWTAPDGTDRAVGASDGPTL